MATLHLPLKAEWYEEIEHGGKIEEYRELSAYWIVRLLRYSASGGRIDKETAERYEHNIKMLKSHIKDGVLTYREFDRVKFSYGYTKRTMERTIRLIKIGEGLAEWGAEHKKEYFVIGLTI